MKLVDLSIRAIFRKVWHFFVSNIRYLEANLSNLGLLISQALSLYLCTRFLSVNELGQFLSISAFGAICLSFIGLGVAETVTSTIASEDEDYKSHNSYAYFVSSIMFVFLVVPFSLSASSVFELIHIQTALLFGTTYLFFGRIVSICENIEVGFGRAHRAANGRLIYAVFQLIAFAFVPFLPFEDRLFSLSLLLTVMGGLASLVVFVWIALPHLAAPKLPSRKKALHGFQFMLGQLVASSGANLDRVIIAAMIPGTQAAYYAFASRIAQISMTPITVYFRSNYRQYFVHANQENERTFLLLSVRNALIISILTTVAAVLGFYILVSVFLTDYISSIVIFSIIIWGNIFTALYYCYANQMSGHFRLVRRNVIDVISAVVLVFLLVSVALLGGGMIWYGIAYLFARFIMVSLAFFYRVKI